MMGKKNLIVGIDPGTTVGYAILDINGNLIELDSAKEIDLSLLITKTIEHGKIIAVGADKSKIPDFVEKFAIKVGARIISPQEDMLVNEKQELTKDYKTKNDHEMDALASALFAYKEINPLLQKISRFVEHHKKGNIKEKIIELIVKDGLNIRAAVDLIEKPEETETKIIKEVIEKKQLFEKDFIFLYNKLKKSQNDNILLKEKIMDLENESKQQKQKQEHFEKKLNKLISDEEAKKLLSQREERIINLYNQIRSKDDEINGLNQEIEKLYFLISSLNENILLKKLDNLGSAEFERKNGFLNIKEGDVLLVDDVNTYSESIINELKNKIKIIVCRKPASDKVKNSMGFAFMDASKLKIGGNKFFAVVKKEDFEKELNSIDLFKHIVREYRKERDVNLFER